MSFAWVYFITHVNHGFRRERSERPLPYRDQKRLYFVKDKNGNR